MFKKYTALCLLLLSACNVELDPAAPSWLRERVEAYRQQPAGQAVKEYEYHGKKVYYVLAPCCDQMNELFDEKGQRICSPDGGFSGKGDGKCPDFRSEAKPVRTLWEDPANHPAQ